MGRKVPAESLRTPSPRQLAASLILKTKTCVSRNESHRQVLALYLYNLDPTFPSRIVLSYSFSAYFATFIFLHMVISQPNSLTPTQKPPAWQLTSQGVKIFHNVISIVPSQPEQFHSHKLQPHLYPGLLPSHVLRTPFQTDEQAHVHCHQAFLLLHE